MTGPLTRPVPCVLCVPRSASLERDPQPGRRCPGTVGSHRRPSGTSALAGTGGLLRARPGPVRRGDLCMQPPPVRPPPLATGPSRFPDGKGPGGVRGLPSGRGSRPSLGTGAHHLPSHGARDVRLALEPDRAGTPSQGPSSIGRPTAGAALRETRGGAILSMLSERTGPRTPGPGSLGEPHPPPVRLVGAAPVGTQPYPLERPPGRLRSHPLRPGGSLPACRCAPSRSDPRFCPARV